jgi:hypothetical protein
VGGDSIKWRQFFHLSILPSVVVFMGWDGIDRLTLHNRHLTQPQCHHAHPHPTLSSAL